MEEKLKTLKELGYEEPTDWNENCRIAWEDFVYISKLKSEAVKWVKDFQKDTNEIINPVWAFRKFFNLTEDDLKSKEVLR